MHRSPTDHPCGLRVKMAHSSQLPAQAACEGLTTTLHRNSPHTHPHPHSSAQMGSLATSHLTKWGRKRGLEPDLTWRPLSPHGPGFCHHLWFDGDHLHHCSHADRLRVSQEVRREKRSCPVSHPEAPPTPSRDWRAPCSWPLAVAPAVSHMTHTACSPAQAQPPQVP